MRNTLVVITVVTCNAVGLAGEIRGPASEREYRSANGRYAAHVTPAKNEQKPHLEVFEGWDPGRVLLWQCDLGNETAPAEAVISDDGQCVVTCNEWSQVPHSQFVLAFYGKGSLVKHYSLGQVLHSLQGADSPQSSAPAADSTTSSSWDRNSVKLLDDQAARLCFGIWLASSDRWLVWDARTGMAMALDQGEIRKWNDKARSWAIKQIEKTPSEASCTFLATRRNPDDRVLLEGLLSSSHFGANSQSYGSARPLASNARGSTHLKRYCCFSTERLLADQSLAKWEGKVSSADGPAHRRLHYLGMVEGTVTLPQLDDPNKAKLWVYLVPADVAKERWAEKTPVHYMTATFHLARSDKTETRAFPFGISTVTPGQYWIKTVLATSVTSVGQGEHRALSDRLEALIKGRDSVYVPLPGDHENVDAPMVTVVAGKIEDVSVACTHVVTDGTR